MLELIIASAVMSITFIALYGYFMSIRQVNTTASNMVIATQVAQQQMELYRNTPYNTLTVGTTDLASILTPYPSLRTPRTATSTITEVQPSGYKQVDVTVTYKERGGTKTVKLTTLIAAQGINR